MPRREIVTETPRTEEELDLIQESVNPEDWMELVEEARRLVRIGDENVWNKGDVAKEAADKYGRLKELCEEIGESYSYWKLLSSIASRYTLEERTEYPTLTFAHYKIAVSQPNKMEWLKRAAQEGWNTLELASQIRQSRNPNQESRSTETKEETPTYLAESAQTFEAPPIEELTFSQVLQDTSSGRNDNVVFQDAVHLLNMIAERDPDVAKSMAMSKRPCSQELDEWIAEAFDREPSGIGVMDIINLIFLDQGIIEYNEASGIFETKY